MATPQQILAVEGLKKYFPIRAGVFSRVTGHVKAVDGIDFNVKSGEAYGLVGESGCGKSTAGMTILRLLEPTGGKVLFKDKDLNSMGKDELRKLRREMQIIYQDPYSSLNPRMSVGEAIGEPLEVHGIASGKERRDRVVTVLKECGLDEYQFRRYPHEFSGGQRQRIGVARALVMEPEFIVADEPVSALDVSIQSQIINLLERLQEKYGLTFLFISHDLSVVKHISDRVGVMYLGRIVEDAPKGELYSSPLHPYSQALLSAVPTMQPKVKKDRIILKGDVPSPANPPPGCPFHPRCPWAEEICSQEVPALRKVGTDHYVSCHLVKEKT
ncbi:MAG: ATP-binding cassette domain-containing protein [Bacillota bacterium]